jgi:dTDP-4-dehydrorhamnose reductase
MKLLITGASGMLGHSLIRLASQRHEVWGSYNSFPVSFPRSQTFAMELTDMVEVKERVISIKPEAIIHTAALTNVDACEENPSRAELLNAQATNHLALLAAELEIHFVYISTDYVFDGKRGDYIETDIPSPINVYGQTKLLGEKAVQLCCPEALVIRTSIFGFNIQPKTGIVENIIKLLETEKPIRRFSDQFSTPIYTGDLSPIILRLLDLKCTGLFHVGGGEKVSRHSFTLKAAEVFSLPQEMICAETFRHLKGLAERPRDTSLCGEKIESHLRMGLPKVREGLVRLKEDLRLYQEARVKL